MSDARHLLTVPILVALAVLSGCQSGVERDIVQRELRQQEDQIYALEDYLSEYQQLLCDARSENSNLKQQIAKGQFRDESSGSILDRSDSLPSPPRAKLRQLPGGSGDPEIAPSVTPPEVPPLDLSDPSVPPLEDQSATEPSIAVHAVQPASAEVEVIGRAPMAVELRGEVSLDDPESGPRVLVEVVPVDDEEECAVFCGQLSLMVLDPSAREREQQLARWEFQPDELDPMAQHSGAGTYYEFPLQLPAEVPTDRPLELWVRLVPEDGEKLLSHTTMDVSRAGRFASVKIEPTREEPTTPILTQATAPAAKKLPSRRATRVDSNVRQASIRQSEWHTARPGQISTPLAEARKSMSEWKLATRPIPETQSTPVRRYLPPYSIDPTVDVPAWSPDRENDDAAKPQPAWSPTR